MSDQQEQSKETEEAKRRRLSQLRNDRRLIVPAAILIQARDPQILTR